MNLSAPTTKVFWLSVAVMTLGVLGVYTPVPFVSDNPYWFMGVGYGLLFLGNVLKGF